MLPCSNFDSSPVGERKRLSLFAAKDSAIFTTTWLTTNNNNIPIFCFVLKYILTWEIKALKQYPLITKEVWMVLGVTSRTRASCLTGVSRHFETIKARGLRLRAFICLSVSGYPGQGLALVFNILHDDCNRIRIICSHGGFLVFKSSRSSSVPKKKHRNVFFAF